MMLQYPANVLRAWSRRRRWRRRGVQLRRSCHIVNVDFRGRAKLEERCRLIGDPRITVGDHFYANVDCHFLGEITFGDDVSIGPKTVIWGRDHCSSRDELIRKQGYVRRRIRIGSDVWIGAQCTILKGVHIGSGVVIGAGSVVIGNIPEYAVAVGNPAKVVKFRQGTGAGRGDRGSAGIWSDSAKKPFRPGVLG